MQLLSQFKNKTKPIKGRERQKHLALFCATKNSSKCWTATITFHCAVTFLRILCCEALSQSSLWGCGCGCTAESVSVHCRNVAGHRRLWNFSIKSQCVSIGYLGLFLFFVFSFFLFFLFSPVRCPSVSFPFMSAGSGGGEVGKCCKTPAGCWRRQAAPMTGGARQCWARFPGHGARGHGEGKPPQLGQPWLQGAPSMCRSSSQKPDLFFERAGEIINHGWWRQSWSD